MIVDSVDDDGTGNIEFPEFLGILKKGNNTKDETTKGEDLTAAIYNFFTDLTSGKMKIEGKNNIPFSLFVTTMRRRKIL